MSSSPTEPLVCPSCAATYPLDERFCPRCGMPLVYASALSGRDPVTATHERARKIKKQYAEGDLVRVAGARNQTEAEFIQGLLLEEGVPSVLRRTRGFDVPDFLAAGPRDVLVPASGAETAAEVLLQSDLAAPAIPSQPALRVALWLAAACAVVALAVWLISQ
jgi:pimeloyl-ACP methyl ester carboxylesterase